MSEADEHAAHSVPEFPIEPRQSIGKFWLADSDEGKTSVGVCRVEGGRIEVEVADPLTPWMKVMDQGDVVGEAPVPEQTDFTVHGAVPVRPGNVTFLGARTVSRRTVHLPGGDAPQLQRMRADWCIAGANVPGPGARFTGVRARFTHLELWAGGSPVDMTYLYKPANKVSMSYAASDPEGTSFAEFEESAQLQLRTIARTRPPSPWGASLSTYRVLELSELSGWTLDEAMSQFVRPVQTLMTLLAGDECSVTHLELEVDGRWCPVYGDAVQTDAPRPSNEQVLLTKDALPTQLVASWCSVVERLSPQPQVVAAVLAGSFQTMEAEALALTTAAEGLDRALNPSSHRFTEAEVSESIEALNASDVPDKVRRELVNALNLYFADDSYPTRLERLADQVHDVCPACVGKPKRWKRCIADLRNVLAHRLPEAEDDSKFWQMHAASLSLRWAMVVRLLLEAGVPSESLEPALDRWEPFNRHARFWRNRLPEVFDG